MSAHTTERVLWLLGNDPREAERFKQDPRAYLSTFRLEGQELACLESLDVQRLAALGIHPLLLLGAYRAVKGPDSVPEYMQRLNAPL